MTDPIQERIYSAVYGLMSGDKNLPDEPAYAKQIALAVMNELRTGIAVAEFFLDGECVGPEDVCNHCLAHDFLGIENLEAARIERAFWDSKSCDT